MRRPVSISIKGSMFRVSSDREARERTDPAEQIQQQCSGMLHMTEDMVCLQFTQKEESGPAYSSLFKVHSGKAQLIRKGMLSTHMIFEEGKCHAADYEMSTGCIPLQVFTRRIAGNGIFQRYLSAGEEKAFPDRENVLVLEYMLLSSGQPVSENRLELEISMK